ncbi:hypothetical protein F0562_032057 [Nyssa sinensis]|uniref:Uncharacterized protein n=1 Tax=Nyssa sinensis TaxID=561372 RepID=A0A5J5AWA5_9ASTE|nr:hypothetical protein F0562_032057 [Nyssa sinensis]
MNLSLSLSLSTSIPSVGRSLGHVSRSGFSICSLNLYNLSRLSEAKPASCSLSRTFANNCILSEEDRSFQAHYPLMTWKQSFPKQWKNKKKTDQASNEEQQRYKKNLVGWQKGL